MSGSSAAEGGSAPRPAGPPEGIFGQPKGGGAVLVLNAGSSSLKTELFGEGLESLGQWVVSEIGGAARLKGPEGRREVAAADIGAALDLVLEGIDLSSLVAAGHRVVHGGAALTGAVQVDAGSLAEIAAAVPLAPLHNPANLAGIRAMAERLPDLPQTASFDTAFHASMPEVAATYALPEAERARGLRRYGFHGLSYAGMVAGWDGPLPGRLLAFHLGNGASLCAIREGRSVHTSMGYSPLDGLTMGTRTGAIDGMAVLDMAERHGVAEAGRLLNRESGLKGLAGTNDMATLLARDDAQARFAVEHFCHWAAVHGGAAVVAMGGLDAVAFTGGIGENAGAVRDAILARLALFGDIPAHVIPADEERQIARDCQSVLGL